MMPTLPDEIRFQTTFFLTAAAMGNGTNGNVDIHFFTPEGQSNYVTHLTVNGVRSMYECMGSALAATGDVSGFTALPGSTLDGAIPPSNQTKTYFGQSYDINVLQALGVLMMRANLLDQHLIALDVALTGMSPEQAHARYYATTNMKARLDNLRVLIDASNIDQVDADRAKNALEDVGGATGRRNDLVHGRWNFRNGKHRVTVYKPGAKVAEHEITATSKSSIMLAEDYYSTAMLLLSATQAISEKTASKTAATPSAGEDRQS